jgi:hypothetical protein
MILGIKRSKMLLVTNTRKIVAKIEYKLIREMQVHASSIVFIVQGFKNHLKVDTPQSYQISKLIERYSKDLVTRKLSDWQCVWAILYIIWMRSNKEDILEERLANFKNAIKEDFNKEKKKIEERTKV